MEKTEKLCEACGKEKKGHYKKICHCCYNRIRAKSEDFRQKMKERNKKRLEESRKIACVSCERVGTVLQSIEKKICYRCIYRKRREEEREIKRLCDIKRLI